MTRHLHDIVNVNPRQIHQRGPRPAGRMTMNEIALGNPLQLGRAALGRLNLHLLRETRQSANLLDVTVDALVRLLRDLQRVVFVGFRGRSRLKMVFCSMLESTILVHRRSG